MPETDEQKNTGKRSLKDDIDYLFLTALEAPKKFAEYFGADCGCDRRAKELGKHLENEEYAQAALVVMSSPIFYMRAIIKGEKGSCSVR